MRRLGRVFAPQARSANDSRPPWWLRRKPMQAFFGVFFLLGAGIVATPFVPAVVYALLPPAPAFPYATRLQREAAATEIATPPPDDPRIVIPAIGVNIPIVEGASDAALQYGAWHMPQTAAAPDDGNFVVSAHRFRYRPPASETFYLLDKLRPGDVVLLYWDEKEYDYVVRSMFVVEPSDIAILDPTPTPTLTLLTCTPLFSTAQRLVVTAVPL